MKKTTFILTTAMIASLASANEGLINQFNDLGYGTLSGKLQTLSMYRDFENHPEGSAYSSTLGLQLNYLSPEFEGWQIGASYVGAGVLNASDYNSASNPGEALLGNGRVNVLNEAYINYNMKALGLTNTTATVGRKITNGEVFRADEFRQKSRSISAIQADSKDVNNFRIAGGHAFRMSNWIDAGDLWEFNNFGDVFNGATDDTAGVTWGETAYTGIEKLEVAVFDAVAWDVANLLGGRAKYDLTEETSVLGYLRLEGGIGDNDDHGSTTWGASVIQKIEAITLEAGLFSVSGDSLEFQETSTGINHALGASMMLYSGQFLGGANTIYAKVTTKLESTKTVLYGLYNYTRHDDNKTDLRQAQEFNLVIKQPIPKIDNLTAALKLGIGTQDGIQGRADTLATDSRLFITYTF